MVLKIKNDLKPNQFSNADENYRNQLILLQTIEIAMHDMEKYHKALDKVFSHHVDFFFMVDRL